MNIGMIYQMIKEKNEATGNQNAWIDLEENTIWLIGKDDTVIRLHAENAILKDMTEEEVAGSIRLALAQDWEEDEEIKPLWFPIG